MSEIDDAFEWLEAHMDKHVAVIEVRLVNALLHHIEEARQDHLSAERDKPGEGFPGPEHQTEGWKR